MQSLTLRAKAAGSHLLSSSKCTTSTTRPCHCRSVSTSPYGRTHIWKRRLPVLPNPTIPKFPQTIIRSDGTSFVQWTTSPKSLVRLTRDTTNNPIWNTGMWISDVRGGVEEEVGSAGRMGRFNRKFGSGVGNVMVDSNATAATTTTTTTTTTTSSRPHEEGGREGGAKREEGEKEAKGEVKKATKVKEDMLDLTGMGMGMGMGMDMSMGMGGSLDDVMWYEDMAKMTGGEPSAPAKVKKEKEEKKEEKKEKKEKKGKK